MQALGFIETRSLTASIEASDVMTKTADVWVVGTEKIGSGLVNVVIQGDVDAVTAAKQEITIDDFSKIELKVVRGLCS